MFTRVETFLQSMMDAFLTGDLARSAGYCDYPMRVTLAGRSFTLQSQAEMVLLLRHLTVTRLAAGQTATRAEVWRITPPEDGVFCASVRWHHRNPAGQPAGHTDMIYTLRDLAPLAETDPVQTLRVLAADATELSLEDMADYPGRRRFTV